MNLEAECKSSAYEVRLFEAGIWLDETCQILMDDNNLSFGRFNIGPEVRTGYFSTLYPGGTHKYYFV